MFNHSCDSSSNLLKFDDELCSLGVIPTTQYRTGQKKETGQQDLIFSMQVGLKVHNRTA